MRVYFFLFIALVTMAAADAAQAESLSPRVEMKTSQGIIVIELDPVKAPATTANFLSYVKGGFYNGTIFHRVIPDFMIQGGGFTKEMARKETSEPIPNEADNGLKNKLGTIAMARTRDPHSATAQFFINTKDNPFLDHKNKSVSGWGYCVFGRVVKGLDVVQAIEKVPTTTRAGHRDVPAAPVIIQTVRVLSKSPES